MASATRPILFGNATRQRWLLEMYERGEIRKPYDDQVLLFGSGLAWWFERGGRKFAALDRRHPAFEHVLAVLGALSGKPEGTPPAETPSGVHSIEARYPLAHFAKHDFRVTQRVVESGEFGADAKSLASRLPDVWPETIEPIAQRLIRLGVLTRIQDGRFRISPAVPTAFAELVAAIARQLAVEHPQFGAENAAAVARVAASVRAGDDAPRVFTTDLRLRTLMALAKYGPMDFRDLKRTVGGYQIRHEGVRRGEVSEAEWAPLGRGRVARKWPNGDGHAAGLDPDYPCARELRRFLLKMEEAYPLGPAVRLHPVEAVPERRAWRGDLNVLFGGFIASRTLACVGHLGWAYVSLCARAAAVDLVPARKVLKRMEDDGILEGDRERRPGFDVRILTVASDFPARDELLALARRYVEAFPVLNRIVERALRAESKTVGHLRKRGLIS